MHDGRLEWGILATGGIAHLFTKDLLAHGHAVRAVASRTIESAQGFARAHGIERAYSSYEALAADPDVDVIYVATPHHLHAENARLALEHGKHVLVEKSFMMTEREAIEITELAARRGLVVMEAMWTRFLPHMRFVREVIASGRLGELTSVHAEHAQSLPLDPAHRLNDPRRAGGALLDLGIYPISFASDLLGPATHVQAHATFTPTGVDASVSTIMEHAGDAISTSYSSMRVAGRNTAAVLGTEARIEIGSVWYMPAKVTVFSPAGAELEVFDEPVTGRGMQYQAEEVEQLIRAGSTSSLLMPASESVSIMATMDAVRAAIGLRYPWE